MGDGLTALPTTVLAVLFVASASVIAVAGFRLARMADELADRTGLGEAIVGAVFIGAMTSLPGIITSAVTAWAGFAQLAVSNALGGIAAQTMFLSLADLAYRRSNLGRAAASAENLVQAAVLICLLSLVLAAFAAPRHQLLAVHPFSVLLVLAYAGGMRTVVRARAQPGWQPAMTPDTVVDTPASALPGAYSMPRLWLGFLGLAAAVAAAGYLLSRVAIALVVGPGLSETLIGSLFTAVATSLPELMTAIAAVRIGALTLAISVIIGGNCFDVIFLAVADGAYRGGSIYAAVGQEQQLLLGVCLLTTAIILVGLLRRGERALGRLAVESALVLAVYAAGMARVVMAAGQ